MKILNGFVVTYPYHKRYIAFPFRDFIWDGSAANHPAEENMINCRKHSGSYWMVLE